MDALVMAGGRGKRMGGVEKPVLDLCGKPMACYVIDALLESKNIEKIYIVISPNVPSTISMVNSAYRNNERVKTVMTPGAGYVEDAAAAVKSLKIGQPFLIISSDVPLVTAEIIDRVIYEYWKSGKEALSVRLHASGIEWVPDTVLNDTGSPTVPAAINVIHGGYMGRAQEEAVLMLDEPLLSVNVNYEKDLGLCRSLLLRRANR